MIITQEKVVDRQTVLHIELEDQDVDAYLDRGFMRVGPRTVVPGFRKGKAPRRIVEQFVGREGLLNEVLDSMLPEVAGKAITEQELDAAGMPSLELLELDPLTLKATVPLTPTVELGPYRDVRIARDVAEVTQEEIDQRIEQTRESMATWEPVDRPVAMGDMVTLEAKGSVEGSAILDEKDAVVLVDSEAARPFPGFSEKLTGLVKDEPAEFSLTIPEDYSNQAVAGKVIEFAVSVQEVKQRILPELDDEFAKGYGDGHESLEALRKQLEEQLTTEAENTSKERHREAVVGAVVDSANLDLPPVMVDHELRHLEENQARIFGSINIRMDDYLKSIGKTEEEMREEMREEAVNRLKRSFVLSRVGEAEGLELSDEDVKERVETASAEAAARSGPPPDADELEGSVRQVMMVETVVDRLSAIALGEAPEGRQETATKTEEATTEEGGDANDVQA